MGLTRTTAAAEEGELRTAAAAGPEGADRTAADHQGGHQGEHWTQRGSKEKNVRSAGCGGVWAEVLGDAELTRTGSAGSAVRAVPEADRTVPVPAAEGAVRTTAGRMTAGPAEADREGLWR